MKKSLSVILSLVLLLAIAFSGCGEEPLNEKCEHKFTEEKVKQATCTDEGKIVFTCTLCGGTQSEKIEPTGHDYESKITKEATCGDEGEKTYSCKNCGDEYTEDIVKTKHSYTEKVKKAATCQETGLKMKVCKQCGDETEIEIPIAKHNYKKITTRKATCLETGIQTLSCTVCGDEKETDIPALGHNYNDKNTKKATCTEDGIRTSTCSRCGDSKTTFVKALGHSWKKATCETPKKCTSCGKTSGNSLGHNDNGSGTCSRCGENIKVDMCERVGEPINDDVLKFSFGKNSADGIKLYWEAENLSGKTINYYTVKVYFENAVGDPAYDEITGRDYAVIKTVGPVEPGRNLLLFNIVGYVPTCAKVIIGDITLQYSDGTTETGWYGYYTTNRSLRT